MRWADVVLLALLAKLTPLLLQLSVVRPLTPWALRIHLQGMALQSMSLLHLCSEHGEDRHTWSPGEKVPNTESFVISTDRHFEGKTDAPHWEKESHRVYLDRVLARYDV